jgi:acyl-CoA thioesterase I
MHRAAAVSRPAWMMALSGGGGGVRRSPVEFVATAASYVTRTPAADLSGLRGGPFGRWADGVTAMRGDCAIFASHWQAHNDQVLAEPGPLWVVLGDSTAQGLGALSPEGGYVGQVRTELRRRTGRPWRVLNLSVSGALTRDVLHGQLPRLPAGPDLVTCGIGVNDVLYTAPTKLFGDLRTLIGAIPDGTVMLDLPLPAGIWGILGRISVPYVARINRTIHEAARARGLPVAEVSGHFLPPWRGKFASDCFHPSQHGYRDWSRALLAAIPLASGGDNPGREAARGWVGTAPRLAAGPQPRSATA